MPKPKSPRHGSMQFWPRKRAKRSYPRIHAVKNDSGLQAFAGYKMGMTRVLALDTGKNSLTKNEQIMLPCTILECPSMHIFSVRGYTRQPHGLTLAKEVIVAPKDKHLARKVTAKPSALPDSFDFPVIHVVLMTQPAKTGIGQKKPQLFEIPIDSFDTAKALVGKDIKASELFKEGDYLDFHAVTTGRGTQGPVKRFGIGLKGHKSEKSRRTPGSLGGWSGQQHVMYRVAMAGQTGYQQRVQYNNQILKITDNPDEINVKGGFINYGTGRKGNEFLVVRGSVPGPKKRMITLVKAIRLKKAGSLPTVDEISLESVQGL